MTTAYMTIDALDTLATAGCVSEETAQIIQFLIEWVDEGDDEGGTWDWLGSLSTVELRDAIIQDDAEEPREWSAGFDWTAVEWGRVRRYLPHVCGVA